MQYKKRKEAERLLEEDQRRLRKEMNAKRAREEAEKLHQVDDQCSADDFWIIKFRLKLSCVLLA